MNIRLTRWQLMLALFFFALALRCYGLGAPLLDTHSWRQADTAAIARNFVASGYRWWLPQVDWGGATAGYVESEFPLYTGMLALLFGMFGAHEWLGRLLSALASAATPLVLYALVRQQNPASAQNQRVALYSALTLAVLPFAVYFGRAVMPDSLMVLAATVAIWSFQRWLQQPNMPRFLLALLCGALAPLAKTPNLVIVAVPLACLVQSSEFRILNAESRSQESGVRSQKVEGKGRLFPWLVVYGMAFALPVLLWTRYAATLPSDPRLSFGIGEKLFDLRLLADPQFYLLLGRWIVADVLTWAGVVCVALLAFLAVTQEDKNNLPCFLSSRLRVFPFLAFAWLLGVFAFLVVGAAGVVGQDYYVLPLVGPAAWLVGAGIAAAREWAARRRALVAHAIPVVALLAIGAFSFWRVAPMYQTTDFYRQLGQRLNAALPQGERVGVIAPAVSEILYYAERKGWRLDPGVVVAGGLSSLGPDLGVRYVLITDPALSGGRDVLTQDLRAYRRMPVGPYALLLDLQQPGYSGDFEMAWETGNVVEAPFLETWRERGGTATLGFPISDAVDSEAGRVQYFERAVLLAEGATVRFAPAGRWLVQARNQTPQFATPEGAFAEAWQRHGGEATLGVAISPVQNGVQLFENGALEQRGDGSVQLGAVGRWLKEVQSAEFRVQN